MSKRRNIKRGKYRKRFRHICKMLRPIKTKDTIGIVVTKELVEDFIVKNNNLNKI